MFKKQKPQVDRKEIREERFKKIASRRVQEILDKTQDVNICTWLFSFIFLIKINL